MTVRYWTGATDGDYGTAGNWSPAAVPIANDDVVIQGSVSITGSLDQSGVAIDTFTVLEGYTGSLGTVDEYLQLGVDTEFEYSATGGPSYIALGAVALNCYIHNTKALTGGTYGLYLKGGTGVTALTRVIVNKGAVHINEHGGGANTSEITTINVGYVSNQASDARVLIPIGTTLTNLNITGGVVELQVAATTIVQTGGELTTSGQGAITTINTRGGTFYPKSRGTITTLNAEGGIIDFSRDQEAKTVTTLNADGSTITLDLNKITVTNLNGAGVRTIS